MLIYSKCNVSSVFKMDTSSIYNALTYESDVSSNVNDDFLDPDFHISDHEIDELDGILVFDTDSDYDEHNKQCKTSLLNLSIIDESDDDKSTETASKKRKLNLSKWQRNVAKEKKAKGEEHISLRKKYNPPRVIGPDCLCNKRCFLNVSDEVKINLLSAFNSIGDKCKQDTYLGGLIRINPIQRHRSRDGSRPNITCSMQYEVRFDGNVISVCKKAFCSIFGVSKTAVDRIIKKIKNNIPSPTDERGKHQNRVNKLPDNINFQINTHINSFPKRQSHYSRSDNSNTRYLSPDLSVAKLYRMYLKKYESDFWAIHNTAQNEGREITIKPKVKYAYYANYFASNFNISFAYPRSDTCQTCDQLHKSIQNETNAKEKESLNLEKELHLRKAQVFYTHLKELSAESKINESMEVLSFDFQKKYATSTYSNWRCILQEAVVVIQFLHTFSQNG